jgi:sugar lactone lactonase YvrE
VRTSKVTKLWLAAGALTVAAFAATGALGVSGDDTITTIAGTGVRGYSGDGGPATAARLNLAPYGGGVAVDGAGNVYFADASNHRVRKVSAAGTITTVAGTGVRGFSGDGGPATRAQLFTPDDVALDREGNLYIADVVNDRVRRVGRDGTITTVAGSGRNGFGGDGGPATAARLTLPDGVAVDGQGNLYISDTGNHRVRKVSRAGTITTIAGNGTRAYGGDGGPATQAQLFSPEGLAVDGRGNVYIVDSRNFRIRKVSPQGTITTFAGTGVSGFSGDGGPATRARLALFPPDFTGLAIDGRGNVYIADGRNGRVRVVTPAGTISTVAGTGSQGRFGGDGGPASKAQLAWPLGVAVDTRGNLYIADTFNHRVRKVTAGSAGALTLTLGGPTTQRLTTRGLVVIARCNAACSLVAGGTVRIPGKNHAFALRRATAPLGAGTRTLRLRLSPSAQKRFRQLLGPGQRAQATITVRAAGRTGGTSTSKRVVTVR